LVVAATVRPRSRAALGDTDRGGLLARAVSVRWCSGPGPLLSAAGFDVLAWPGSGSGRRKFGRLARA